MLNWNKLSLKSQFLILIVLVQILILILTYVYFPLNFTQFYLNQVKLNLEDEIDLILNNDQLIRSMDDRQTLDLWIKKIGKEVDTRITIIDTDGTVLADSVFIPEKMDNYSSQPEIAEVLEGDISGKAIRYSNALDTDMFYLASPIIREGQTLGAIRLAKSLKDINGAIKKNLRNYLLFFVLIIVLTTFLAWKFSSEIINPLNKVARVAGKIAGGDFHERIQLKHYENEIGTMARRFNFMADQLERKIAEISHEKSKAEAILSSMVDGVIAVDNKRKVLITNPAAVEMLNIVEDDIEGKDIIEVVRHHKIDDLLQQVLENNLVLSEEIILQKNDKKIFRCHLAPIINESGETKGGVILFTDITELRRLEEVRKDFVANVSHELRTPLTSIIGYLDTLLESNIDDPRTTERFLRIIKDEADRLALLIRDLLDLSRLEKKDYQDYLKPHKLQPIINKTLEMLRDRAEEKEIELKKDIQEELPLLMMIPEQIEQVLINLVDNAIKYTPEGGAVTVRTFNSEDRAVVEVEDNGIGIPEEDLERIFERFYRVDKARSRALGGTGIGLSIVKHILHNHGSQIEVESQIGEGSTFRFYLQKAH